MNCCIAKKKAREEFAHKSQSIDTDEFETGTYIKRTVTHKIARINLKINIFAIFFVTSKKLLCRLV